MSAWTDVLTDERKAKAKIVYEKLEAIGWRHLSGKDRAIMTVLGFMSLEIDEVDLEGICDYDFDITT